jgi:ATP synthase protein I
MTIINDRDEGGLDEADDFEPLTPEQARAFRQKHPQVSPWRVISWQAGFGLLLAVLAGWYGGSAWGFSAAYGVLSVVLPGMLFARGVQGRFASLNPGSAMVGFFLWELMKLIVTVVMLALAPRIVVALSWPVMLVALVLTLKVYWVALAVRPRLLKHEDR